LDHDIAKTPGTALQHLFAGGKMQQFPSEVSQRPRNTQPRVMPIPVRAVAPPAPPKENPFVMEIISGPTKREQKFGGTPEVK
jgi:hypothetical protein